MKIGIRLRNPGCIRRVEGQKWEGQSIDQTDDNFVTFATMPYGLRAVWRIMDSYYNRHGLRTIEGIIYRWAPPQDGNDTALYIESVSDRVLLSPTTEIASRPKHYFYTLWGHIVRAICEMESGYRPTFKELRDSWEMAFGSEQSPQI